MDMEFATTLYDLNKAVEKPTVEYARENLKCEGVPEGHYMCFFGIDLLAPRIMEILQHNYDNGIRTKGMTMSCS
jgi:UTP--glucose-1-phosphate uridylyltransferase